MHFYDIELPTTLLPQHVRAIFLYVDCNRGFNGLKPSQKHVKLSLLSAAFDPQEIVQRSQSYEGFMPIFGSDGQLEYTYFSGFTHFY